MIHNQIGNQIKLFAQVANVVPTSQPSIDFGMVDGVKTGVCPINWGEKG